MKCDGSVPRSAELLAGVGSWSGGRARSVRRAEGCCPPRALPGEKCAALASGSPAPPSRAVAAAERRGKPSPSDDSKPSTGWRPRPETLPADQLSSDCGDGASSTVGTGSRGGGSGDQRALATSTPTAEPDPFPDHLPAVSGPLLSCPATSGRCCHGCEPRALQSVVRGLKNARADHCLALSASPASACVPDMTSDTRGAVLTGPSSSTLRAARIIHIPFRPTAGGGRTTSTAPMAPIATLTRHCCGATSSMVGEASAGGLQQEPPPLFAAQRRQGLAAASPPSRGSGRHRST